MRLYELSYSWYEDYSPILLVSETEYTLEEWERLCDSLLDEATELAIKTETDGSDKEWGPSWVGWLDIVNAMAVILQKHGFSRVHTISKDYWGGSIIDESMGHRTEDDKLSPKAYQMIKQHNDMVREKMDSEIHNRMGTEEHDD